jgi:hypothetical protein
MYWAGYFGVELQMLSITRDVDLFGTREQAQRAASQLSVPHTLFIADMDRATPNSALLEVRLPGYEAPIIVDFLESVAGLKNAVIKRRAPTVLIGGAKVKVLHPLDCLASKMFNLMRFDGKRTPEGREQARLAIEIAKAFVRQFIHMPVGSTDSKEQQEARESARGTLLKAIETIHDVANSPSGHFVYEEFGFDCMRAIPKDDLNAPVPEGMESLAPPELLATRIPQMEAHVEAKREAARRRRASHAARRPRPLADERGAEGLSGTVGEVSGDVGKSD